MVKFGRFDTFLGHLELVLVWVWLGLVGFGWVWLGLVGFGWIWLVLVGFVWVWLGLVGFGWVCILVLATDCEYNIIMN